MTHCTLLLRQCPHCGTNLVDAELLIPHTCEPGAFHSRLLGVRDPGGNIAGWKCPDCSHVLPLTAGQSTETAAGTTAANYQDLVDKLESLESLVMSIAETLENAHIGVHFEVSEAKRRYKEGGKG